VNIHTFKAPSGILPWDDWHIIIAALLSHSTPSSVMFESVPRAGGGPILGSGGTGVSGRGLIAASAAVVVLRHRIIYTVVYSG
jgi:hypothetical protein